MLRIGLTGGIGSGKSTASDLFAALGVPVIDADVIARKVVEPGRLGFEAVIAAFGRELLDSSGRLDRRSLRAKVFTDPASRKRLESLLHPLIREEIERTISTINFSYVLLVVPLLLESGWSDMVDRVLVVDCPPEVQIQRAMQRDGASKEEIQRIIASQASRQERISAADDVITNDGPPERLAEQVRALHERYLTLASAG